jgi:lysozyme family protein
MAEKNFALCLKLILNHEGGFVNHPKDPGGATNLGITQRVYESWVGYPVDIEEMKSLTVEDVAPIYKANYWDKIKGDLLPSGVDYMVFDFGINSGIYRSAKLLQLKVGAQSMDGHIGPKTLKSVNDYIEKNSLSTLVKEYCDARMAFLKGLPTFATFGKGWTKRVNDVQGLIQSGQYDVWRSTPGTI